MLMADISITINYTINSVTVTGVVTVVNFTMSHTGTGLTQTLTNSFSTVNLSYNVNTSVDDSSTKLAKFNTNFLLAAQTQFNTFAQQVRLAQDSTDLGLFPSYVGIGTFSRPLTPSIQAHLDSVPIFSGQMTISL